MEEALAVGDQVLKVAQLRPVHGWVIDFGDDAIPKRKPDLAGSRVCGSDAVFSAMGPTGMNPGMSKRSHSYCPTSSFRFPVLDRPWPLNGLPERARCNSRPNTKNKNIMARKLLTRLPAP